MSLTASQLTTSRDVITMRPVGNMNESLPQTKEEVAAKIAHFSAIRETNKSANTYRLLVQIPAMQQLLSVCKHVHMYVVPFKSNKVMSHNPLR